jgi:hypothetical protein
MTKAPAAAPVTLRFALDKLTVGQDKTDIRAGLSAVVLHRDRLWLACDEGCRIERLSRSADGSIFDSHQCFELGDLLPLPAAATEEADVEGLDVDGGYLWLVGSHSVKRKKAKATDSPEDVAKKLANVSRDGNRHLLARIPMEEGTLHAEHGTRRAARLKASRESSALLDAIVSADHPPADPHLAPFVPLPGKDNGFDIEGLAVRDHRAFIGLRGPVLREWCCILECHLGASGPTLTLEDQDGRAYRKHFLKLNGLGIRDLARFEDDLLILAGPTMGQDGPAEIWRWPDALAGTTPDAGSVKRLFRLPQSEGVDRPEGLTVFQAGPAPTVLVIFDTPAETRLVEQSSVRADVFRLP